MRAAEELRSARIFRALARSARIAGMPEPWPTRMRSAVYDELRHTRLCIDTGRRLGARAPRYDATPVQRRLGALPDPIGRATALLLIEVAIGETISTYLFRASRRTAKEPLTVAALGSIVGDEIRHQRLGWSALAALWPMLGASRRMAAQREAAQGLAACEKQVVVPAMQWLKSGKPFEDAYATLGVLHPETRIETFYATVENLVLPRLSRLGLDGPLAWQNRYRQRGMG
jgi:hypothetical protein